MILIGIVFILFGFLVILFPQFLAYLIGGFFILIGINLILGIFLIKKQVDKGGARIAGFKVYKE